MSANADFFAHLTQELLENRELSSVEISQAADGLLNETVESAAKANFLKALSRKGETNAELAGFVEAFLKHARDPGIKPEGLPGPMLDVCGTGGDQLDLFNVSTTSMFVLAAGGAVMVKHGGRSVSSQCGSADVLEELGVKIDMPLESLRRCVETLGCGFLFAPHYHPAFKAVAPVRKDLAAKGIKTIFNLLGPLLNPTRPAYQLVGVFLESALSRYATVLAQLGRKSAWALHGKTLDGAGMDEVSTLGPTRVNEVQVGGAGAFSCRDFIIATSELERLSLVPGTLADLRGGTREQNAQIIYAILEGSLRGPKRDIVTLNAAAGFVVCKLAPDLEAGFALANEQIDSGRALAKLKALQAFC